MKQKCLILSLFLLLLFLSLQIVSGQTALTDDEIRAILKDRIDRGKKSVGIVVGLIDKNGTRIVGYGKPEKNSTRALDGDTVFEIGSITKVFTGILLADMVTRGEVRLEDPISKYLPKTVKVPSRNGREITLLDLSNQTSGLPGMPSNFSSKNPGNPYADYSVAQMYEFLSSYQLTRDIGSKYQYSNLGVGLLGHVLALRAGKDYETLVRERILHPLKMKDSGITFTPNMKAHLAKGHDMTLRQVQNWDLPTLAGAGALRSSVDDMLKFLAANIGLKKTPLLTAMRLSHISRQPAGAPDLEIGLNWHILKKFDTEMIWHNGQTGGYHSFTAFDRKKLAGVVVLSNSTNSIDDIGRHLLEKQYPLAKFEDGKERIEIKVDAKILEQYVGEYSLAPGINFTVTRQDAQLYVQLTGQGKFEIYPESETDFFLSVVDAQITFVKDQTGKVTSLVLHQNKVDQTAKKIK